MKYNKIIKGRFISRPNRFVAHVMVDNNEQIAHVKNTGRCKEILIPGATVFLEDHIDNMGSRKTRYSLVVVEKKDLSAKAGFRLINIDSQAPNKVVGASLNSGLVELPGFKRGISLIRPEQTFGKSRFDFYAEGNNGEKAFLEVKGVTLEDEGIARFPDAPTIRGVKHIYELIQAVGNGFKAYVIFVIQMKNVVHFEPNDATHEAFGKALRNGQKAGVHILAYDCNVTEDTISLHQSVRVKL